MIGKTLASDVSGPGSTHGRTLSSLTQATILLGSDICVALGRCCRVGVAHSLSD